MKKRKDKYICSHCSHEFYHECLMAEDNREYSMLQINAPVLSGIMENDDIILKKTCKNCGEKIPVVLVNNITNVS